MVREAAHARRAASTAKSEHPVDHLPIFLDIRGKTVVIAGGGTLAARRTEMALRAGAKVKLFAPELSDEFHDLRAHANLHYTARWPDAADLSGAILAYGAAEHEEADIRLEWVPLADAVDAVLAGRMRNGILAAGVLAAAERARRSPRV